MRQKLHRIAHQYTIHCDPIEAINEDGHLALDLSFDVTGSLTVSSTEVDSIVSDNLKRATVVFTDSSELAKIIRPKTGGRVIPLIWGHLGRRDVAKPSRKPIVGVLNNSHETYMTLMTYQKHIEDIPVVTLGSYGEIPAKVSHSFDDIEGFAANVDILLFPVRPHLLLSLTEILSIMSWRTVVLAVHSSLSYEVNNPGVIYLNSNAPPCEWKDALGKLQTDCLALGNRQEIAQRYATKRFGDSAQSARNVLNHLMN